MPGKPKKLYKNPGCLNLTDEMYCEEHYKLHVTDRVSAASRDYTSEWKKARLHFLQVQQMCVRCK